MSSAVYGQPPLDELVEFVSKFVDDFYRLRRKRVTGATLGSAVRQHFPDFVPNQQFDRPWLAEIVRIAEQRGSLVRHRDVGHLEVSPAAAQCTESTAASGPNFTSPLSGNDNFVTGRSDSRWYVRPDVWRAFVFVSNMAMPHFFDRETGDIVGEHVRNSVPGADSSSRFVPISRVESVSQQAWMSEFVASHGELNPADAPIQADYWWSKFPTWLRDRTESLEFEWRRFRTQKVLDYIKSWADANAIPVASLLATPRPRSASLLSHRTESVAVASTGSEDKVRQAVISAITEMPLDELEQLSIPLRYVLRHFTVR